MRFFIYSRKSVYTGRGESVENQIELCRQYIAAKFSTAGDLTIYEDEGFSAKNTHRPQFQRMLGDLRREKPDFLVCYRLDRISRSVGDFAALIEELAGLGVAFLCIREEFDTSRPMGKAMMYIASVFAQLERETIAERVRDNMLLLARTGRWLGGTAPTGFFSQRQRELILEGKSKTVCQLRENPAELSVVADIFQSFLELRSLSGVCKRLAGRGVVSRSGGAYSPPVLRQILENPVYCAADADALAYFTAQGSDVCFQAADCTGQYGLLAYNKRDYAQKRSPRRPPAQWIIAVGRHRGLISGRQWSAVQRILAENVPTGRDPALTHNSCALLSGAIRCGLCGGRMFAKRRSGAGADPTRYDYICGAKLRLGTAACPCQNLAGPGTDDLVWRRLAPHAAVSPSRLAAALEPLRRDLARQARDEAREGTALRLRQCSKELDRLVALLAREDLGAEATARIAARITAVEAQLARLKEADAPGPDGGCQEAKSPLGSGPLPDLKLPERRALVRLMARRILWDGEDLHLFLAGTPPEKVALSPAAHSQH